MQYRDTQQYIQLYRHRERNWRWGKRGRNRKGKKRRERKGKSGMREREAQHVNIYTNIDIYTHMCYGVQACTLRNKLTTTLLYIRYHFLGNRGNDHSISHTWTVLHASLLVHTSINSFAIVQKKQRIAHLTR